jgi:hypothetical protein
MLCGWLACKEQKTLSYGGISFNHHRKSYGAKSNESFVSTECMCNIKDKYQRYKCEEKSYL